MHRSGLSRLFAVAILMVSTACGSSSTSSLPTTPSNPITETFAGSLSVNGAVTNTFTITVPGTVTATLTAVGPDPTVPVGMSIGTWSGTTCSVGVGLFQDKAVQGAVMVATVSAPGTLCLRMYDSGTLQAPVTFSVDVVHP